MSGRERDTIVAPATPLGRGALAIVRIDGPEAVRIVEDLAGVELEERRARVVRLRDGEELLDEAVAVRWSAPRSYTGNDLVEVTLHGSPALVERLMGAARARGARPAEAGEFTERAVLNGRIDLVQAEAIGDLIASRTALQAKLALANLGGELSRAAGAIREIVLEVLSRLEAALDFAEEDYEFITREEGEALLAGAEGEIASLERTFARGRATTAGITAVIVGRPNAGKSTLLNFLCGSERAIVTPIPGTTRDLLRETVEIGGLPVTLVDTAGLRSTGDAVEQIGIARARAAAAGGEIVLCLVDAVEGMGESEREVLEARPDAIVVYTKADLAEVPEGVLAISVPERRGLDELLARLDAKVREELAVPEGTAAVVNERQRGAVAGAREGVAAAREALRAGGGEEVVAAELRSAARALGALAGEITTDEVLARIFSKFCIGK
ncbi:MAG TPA: tRNA uridine-5-carboxymethylaminomethyl(34) synthesis GTPase MnmE [Thermoanaerobaculia bacterium]|nr:tRNA uridine-5-carboxymethylaminomethyl(34) synthesis GTPase MnmE [Thermoanaerobaculia bacterium]